MIVLIVSSTSLVFSIFLIFLFVCFSFFFSSGYFLLIYIPLLTCYWVRNLIIFLFWSWNINTFPCFLLNNFSFFRKSSILSFILLNTVNVFFQNLYLIIPNNSIYRCIWVSFICLFSLCAWLLFIFIIIVCNTLYLKTYKNNTRPRMISYLRENFSSDSQRLLGIIALPYYLNSTGKTDMIQI